MALMSRAKILVVAFESEDWMTRLSSCEHESWSESLFDVIAARLTDGATVMRSSKCQYFK